MSAEHNRAALAAAVTAWNDDDREGYLSLYDPSVRHHGLGPVALDHQANRAFYESMWAAFPHSTLTIDDTVAEGDQLAARFHVTGTHHGAFMGIPATERTVVISGQTVLRYHRGRVVERWTTTDMFDLMIQLGVIHAPSI
jgi:steroid delta-isomerase-like uncharacterized protein